MSAVSDPRHRRAAQKYHRRFALAAGRELFIRALPVFTLAAGIASAVHSGFSLLSLLALALGSLLLAGDLMRDRRESFYKMEGRIKTAIAHEIDPQSNALLSRMARRN